MVQRFPTRKWYYRHCTQSEWQVRENVETNLINFV